MINKLKVSTAALFTLLFIFYSHLSYGIEIVYTFDGVVQRTEDRANHYGWYEGDPIRIQFLYDDNPDTKNSFEQRGIQYLDWDWDQSYKHSVLRKNGPTWETVPIAVNLGTSYVKLRTEKNGSQYKIWARSHHGNTSTTSGSNIDLNIKGLSHMEESRLTGNVDYENSTFFVHTAFRPYDYYKLHGKLTNSLLYVPIAPKNADIAQNVVPIDKLLDERRTEQKLAKEFGENSQEVSYVLSKAKYFWDLAVKKVGDPTLSFVNDEVDPIGKALKVLDAQGKVLVECSTNAEDCAILFSSNSPSYLYTQEFSDGTYQGMSFNYKGEGLSEDDYLFVAVDDEFLFSIPGTEIPEGEYKFSEVIDLSGLTEGAVLSIGILSEESGKNLYLKDFTFYSEEEAPVNNTQTNYRIDLLGTLGTSNFAQSINDQGQVVGFMGHRGDPNREAFIYEQGEMKALGTLGGTFSEAHSINNLGQAVGLSQNSSGGVEAFIYENGIMKGLGTLDGLVTGKSHAKEINDLGQIVGNSTDEDLNFAITPFIYENGLMKRLDTGVVESINNNGQIAGWGFIYENGIKKSLGMLNGESVTPFSINNLGQVVGFGTAGIGSTQAFIYDNGTIKGLGSLLGSNNAQAESINDLGQIVGYSGEAFIYENGKMLPLFDLVKFNNEGWSSLQFAMDINNKGQIVGNGRFNGSTRAFLLTPLGDNVIYDPEINQIFIPCVKLSNQASEEVYEVKLQGNDDFIFHLTFVAEVDVQSCPATFDIDSSILTIPSVIVDGDTTGTQYFVEMTADENYEFSISNFYTLE